MTFDVPEERIGVESRTRGSPDDIFCGQTVADLMHMAMQPGKQVLELTAIQIAIHSMV